MEDLKDMKDKNIVIDIGEKKDMDKKKDKTELLRRAFPKTIIAFSLLLSVIWLFDMNVVYASGIQGSKFFTGTKKLLEDANNALLILAPIVGGLMCIYFFVRKMASDEMDSKKWSDRIKVSIVCVIIAVGFSAFMSMILSYYQ